ncbi:MAG: 2-keto-3-deoxy-L-fuconate dehydrogenase [Gaiellales bacterium]|jgi:NAD(P)-dependent dehydrogenase (short-subunit alcohol dehydrogenase family)|nr:2-keto-3-deoxy-L-fuconate dehydrogenase [Gaiellales bacterium]
MTFSGQVAVVTGAGSGIGRATALLLAERGAKVLAADYDGDGAEETARLAGGGVVSHVVDVRDEASVVAMFERGDSEWGGRLDIVANIAGIGSTDPAPTTTVEVWDNVFAVNARGVFLGCKHGIPRLSRGGGGAVVNMASVAGVVGLRNRAAYCASKGAVIALTRALAVDHVGDGVRVNCICPGTVDSPWVRRLVEDVGESIDQLTARQPMGRLGTPEEIAGSIAYLASDDAAFMTGSALVIDGGLSAG